MAPGEDAALSEEEGQAGRRVRRLLVARSGL